VLYHSVTDSQSKEATAYKYLQLHEERKHGTKKSTLQIYTASMPSLITM